MRAKRPEVLGAIAAGLIVVVFCLLLLWHDPLLFWNDDYELSILPVFADVARSWSEGHLPLLSPYSWVCSNLAGEFQYGTFSIFVNAAVVLIWKFPLTFPQQAAALSITHLFVLAAGAFLLARDRMSNSLTRRLGRPPLPEGEGAAIISDHSSIPLSIFVALVAALNGWIICWGATDWFGALGAFAWLPWAWWALERSLNTFHDSDAVIATPVDAQISTPASPPAPHHKRLTMRETRDWWRGILWPAPFVYLVVTGGFPYTVVMLALLIAWLAIKSLIETRSFMSILPMLAGVALGFGLSAPAWLAILDYVHGSARELQPASTHWQWIVPIKALPGFILPCWTVNWADFSTRLMPHRAAEMACGLVAPIAIISALINRGSAFVKQIRWELFLLLLVLLLCMLPSAGVFRWSFRWLPFFHLILALCAAEALQSGIGFSPSRRLYGAGGQPMFTGRMPVPRQGVIALLLVGVSAITMSILRTNGEFAFPLTWILLALAGIWVASEWFDSKLRAWVPAALTFAALLATYLCIPPNCGVPKYNLSQELTKPAPLDPQRLYLSIYPPAEFSYRIEQKPKPVGQIVRLGSTSMWAGLRLINGYSPILAAGVAREFNFAIHGEIDPDIGEYLLHDHSGALAEIGVDGMIVARDIGEDPPASEWQLAFENEEGRVYHRPGAPFARVRSVKWIDSQPEREFATAAISRIDDSRNRVEVDVDLPSGESSALLKFSRPYFPGYVARLGHEKLKVGSYRGLLPVVELPAGSRGQLILAYRPPWLIYGGALSILCAIILVTGGIAALRSSFT